MEVMVENPPAALPRLLSDKGANALESDVTRTLIKDAKATAATATVASWLALLETIFIVVSTICNTLRIRRATSQPTRIHDSTVKPGRWVGIPDIFQVVDELGVLGRRILIIHGRHRCATADFVATVERAKASSRHVYVDRFGRAVEVLSDQCRSQWETRLVCVLDLETRATRNLIEGDDGIGRIVSMAIRFSGSNHLIRAQHE